MLFLAVLIVVATLYCMSCLEASEPHQYQSVNPLS